MLHKLRRCVRTTGLILFVAVQLYLLTCLGWFIQDLLR